MLGISFNDMKWMVSVHFVLPYPWATCPSSMHITFIQSLGRSGLSIIFLYFVMVSFVTGCTTLLHCSSISISGESKNLEYCNAVGIVYQVIITEYLVDGILEDCGSIS